MRDFLYTREQYSEPELHCSSSSVHWEAEISLTIELSRMATTAAAMTRRRPGPTACVPSAASTETTSYKYGTPRSRSTA